MIYAETFVHVIALQKTEAEPVEVEVTIIGFSEEDGGAMVLLTEDYEDYRVPAALGMVISVDDLPIKLQLLHMNNVVQVIEQLEDF